MAVWMVRAGRHGEDEGIVLEKGMAVIGWEEMPDLSSIESSEDMRAKYHEVYPDESTNAVINLASQLWAFVRKIQIGDMVILPMKNKSLVAIGKISGNYKYVDGRHTRSVKWIKDNIPRSDIGQDLLYSLGAFMTICQISRNNAEERLKIVMDGKRDPNLSATPSLPKKQDKVDSESDEAAFVDLEEQAFDQIHAIIGSRFKGHNMARLVEAILTAQGYFTYRSPEGADGGVDILAGKDAMGFETPRLCIQVKSGGEQGDGAMRELEGVMSRVGAQQGLFVSWDGFNKTAWKHERELFFKIRLWDDKRLMQALLENYPKLPEQIQAELPLKRIWVSVP